MSLPPAVQSVLDLFQGPLCNVRFADVDAAGLAHLAAEVEAAAADVEAREAALVDLRQTLAQRHEALLALAQQALAYARVYAENNDEQLLETIGGIALPRAAKGRKPSKGDAVGKADAKTSSRDAADGADAADVADSADAEVDAAATSDGAANEAPQRPRRGRPRTAHAAAS